MSIGILMFEAQWKINMNIRIPSIPSASDEADIAGKVEKVLSRIKEVSYEIASRIQCSKRYMFRNIKISSYHRLLYFSVYKHLKFFTCNRLAP